MIIIKIAIGNESEAFIENNFSNNINIISSDDNNKGKTILIQGMMYALGNTPTFPSTFDYTKYYYIVEFIHDGITFEICRNNSLFLIKCNATLQLFENVSEMKRYWHKHICPLPIITKNHFKRIVDPELYLQLFFVGQDKKDTSNIANKGLYNKEDFYNMLYSLSDLNNEILDIEEVKQKKQKLTEFKGERKQIIQQNKILKSEKKPISYLSSENDRMNFKKSIGKIEKIKEIISELQKERNKNVNRKLKCEITIKEMNSLNRNLDSGEIICLECGSTHIGYKATPKHTYTFDISTPTIRKQIMESITYKISDYGEEIERITILINQNQSKLKDLLSVDEISIESLIVYKKDIFSVSEAEEKLKDIDDKISTLESQITDSLLSEDMFKSIQQDLIKEILISMNEEYRIVDPLGNLEFDSIFTKKTEVFSGSEQTIYHLVKVYSLAKISKHKFPIIVDSFRAEDLSTEKEKAILDIFSNLQNQIIFTTTLKNEEIGKYDSDEFNFINHIDYSNHSPSKILTAAYIDDFKKILSNFSITKLK